MGFPWAAVLAVGLPVVPAVATAQGAVTTDPLRPAVVRVGDVELRG